MLRSRGEDAVSSCIIKWHGYSSIAYVTTIPMGHVHTRGPVHTGIRTPVKIGTCITNAVQIPAEIQAIVRILECSG